jgi:hypothetical protein
MIVRERIRLPQKMKMMLKSVQIVCLSPSLSLEDLSHFERSIQKLSQTLHCFLYSLNLTEPLYIIKVEIAVGLGLGILALYTNNLEVKHLIKRLLSDLTLTLTCIISSSTVLAVSNINLGLGLELELGLELG